MNSINTKPIFVDFNNLDESGAVRLNTKGTLEDIKNQNIVLSEKQIIWVSDGEIEMVGSVTTRDGIWVAVPDKNGFKHVNRKNS